MSLVVNTNIASLAAQNNLTNSTGKLERSVERLSSGLRITRAADDAAGLGVSETLRAHIASINQATRNSNDGISLTQIADGWAQSIGTSYPDCVNWLPSRPTVQSGLLNDPTSTKSLPNCGRKSTGSLPSQNSTGPLC